jgi:hypothetical protein
VLNQKKLGLMFQKQLHPGNDLVYICIIQNVENRYNPLRDFEYLHFDVPAFQLNFYS